MVELGQNELTEAAIREARGIGVISQHGKEARYVGGARIWRWAYATRDLAESAIRIARKRARDVLCVAGETQTQLHVMDGHG